MRLLAQLVPALIAPAVIFAGGLGLSVVIAVVADVVAFMTMHVYWLYQATSKATRLQISGINSLWLLFQGKKRNVLKKRIDSQDYNIDQLLLGTLLFCVLVFLLPTSLIYWLLFMIDRVALLAFHTVAGVAIVFIRSFPLVQLSMKLQFVFTGSSLFTGAQFTIRFHERFLTLSEGGVVFELCSLDKASASARASISNSPASTYLRLRSNPSYPLSLMFAELASKLKALKI